MAYAALGMTVVVVLFGEVLPKTFAIARTDRMALAVALPVRAFVFIITPFQVTVQIIVRALLHLCGVRGSEAEPVLTAHEEIRGAIDLHHRGS